MIGIRRIGALCVVLLAALAGEALALGIGDGIPVAGVKMKNVDGRELSIADVKGRTGTLVIFSCNHCPYVRAWEGRMIALGNAAQAQGIGVMLVNPNDPAAYPGDDYADMVQRAHKKGYDFPYVVDATSEVARAFGASHTPEAYLFDRRGVLVYHGAIDDNAEDPAKVEHHYLSDAIDAVAAGKPVPTAEVKAIGCSLRLHPKA